MTMSKKGSSAANAAYLGFIFELLSGEVDTPVRAKPHSFPEECGQDRMESKKFKRPLVSMLHGAFPTEPRSVSGSAIHLQRHLERPPFGWARRLSNERYQSIESQFGQCLRLKSSYHLKAPEGWRHKLGARCAAPCE